MLCPTKPLGIPLDKNDSLTASRRQRQGVTAQGRQTMLGNAPATEMVARDLVFIVSAHQHCMLTSVTQVRTLWASCCNSYRRQCGKTQTFLLPPITWVESLYYFARSFFFLRLGTSKAEVTVPSSGIPVKYGQNKSKYSCVLVLPETATIILTFPGHLNHDPPLPPETNKQNVHQTRNKKSESDFLLVVLMIHVLPCPVRLWPSQLTGHYKKQHQTI